MGLNVSGISTSGDPSPPPGNPRPWLFKIEKIIFRGRNVVVKVFYPGCTNYEGRKILVYLNVEPGLMWKRGTLDPHFSETGFSPFARFEPTDKGWDQAVALAARMWTNEH